MEGEDETYRPVLDAMLSNLAVYQNSLIEKTLDLIAKSEPVRAD